MRVQLEVEDTEELTEEHAGMHLSHCTVSLYGEKRLTPVRSIDEHSISTLPSIHGIRQSQGQEANSIG